MRQQLDTAIRLSLAGQVRNRFAWILLVAFVPVWYLLIGSMIAHHGIGFTLRATGDTLVVDGHNLTLITAGLSSITLITGFVVFAAVRRTRAFDRRLVLGLMVLRLRMPRPPSITAADLTRPEEGVVPPSSSAVSARPAGRDRVPLG